MFVMVVVMTAAVLAMMLKIRDLYPAQT